MKGGLRVASDMGDDALEDRGLVGRSARLGVEVLKLDLFPAKVVSEAVKLAGVVLFALVVFKDMVLDTLPHQRRVFIQDTAHGGQGAESDGWGRILMAVSDPEEVRA